MLTHKCCHGRGPECLDDPTGCGAPFPSPSALRVLKRVRPGEEEFRDVATGQRFKARRGKDGTRLVPLFKGRVKWGSAEGYDAVRLFLSCLGSEGRYTLWSEATGAWSDAQLGQLADHADLKMARRTRTRRATGCSCASGQTAVPWRRVCLP